MSPTGDLLVTFIFLWGRCPLELAQRPPCVALALHLARRSTPFGVTIAREEILAARARVVLPSATSARTTMMEHTDTTYRRRPFPVTRRIHNSKSNTNRNLCGKRAPAGDAAGSNLPG
jgi:hypothetical protein